MNGLLWLFICVVCSTVPLHAEDGYDLWLRYRPLTDQTMYSATITQCIIPAQSSTFTAIRTELTAGLSGLIGRSIASEDTMIKGNGAIIVGTPSSSSIVSGLGLTKELDQIGNEGFLIRSMTISNFATTVIAAKTDIGALYGTFHFLRLIQTQKPLENLNLKSAPLIKIRLLNHWDNLNDSIERGYAGKSLWNWGAFSAAADKRLIDYARANASIGINGAVLNNVNADSRILTNKYLSRIKAIAGLFRPYGIKVYLSVKFTSPTEIDKVTSDPAKPDAAQWWTKKADQIYDSINDFGGFLVKANSEGQPGPGPGKHAIGANCIAEGLKAHNGILMWRAFVYDTTVADRAKAAFNEFDTLDGAFSDNVFLQVKNGPIDFQPREPPHPLFGSMPNTPLLMEFQITEEYLGQSTHGTYLGPMWKEVLDFDILGNGADSRIAKIIDGSLRHHTLSGIAGVANTGSNRNWCGHDLLQANWYAFGRLAWDHTLSAEAILREWLNMTWTNDPDVVNTMTTMMMNTHEACVNFQEPLGLVHLMASGEHYDPGPWVSDQARPDWNPVYYHKADKVGIGFNRTTKGSDAVSQYPLPIKNLFNDINTCPEKYLLFFHHVCWSHRMKSNRTLWEELKAKYNEGVASAGQVAAMWKSLEGKLDNERFNAVNKKMNSYCAHAQKWRDTCMGYFNSWYEKRIACPDSVAVSSCHSKALIEKTVQSQWKLFDLSGRLVAASESGRYSLQRRTGNTNPMALKVFILTMESKSGRGIIKSSRRTLAWIK